MWCSFHFVTPFYQELKALPLKELSTSQLYICVKYNASVDSVGCQCEGNVKLDIFMITPFIVVILQQIARYSDSK